MHRTARYLTNGVQLPTNGMSQWRTSTPLSSLFDSDWTVDLSHGRHLLISLRVENRIDATRKSPGSVLPGAVGIDDATRAAR